ncbi:MAG TPA: DNA methyltransferase [Bellilinea sp.]|nr:DNA methyltransferase [Bellilinea sp.]
MSQKAHKSLVQLPLGFPNEQASPHIRFLDTPVSNIPYLPLFTPYPNPDLGALARPGCAHKQVELPHSVGIIAGKNSYVYDAHTYHTKIPPQGIKSLIQYYTDPDEVVLDPFCGSGMTGVAALELGRAAILTDLSPAAAFISFNHITPACRNEYIDAVNTILEQSKDLETYLYGTHCRECGCAVNIEYTVWSYGMLCPSCQSEFILWDVARDIQPRVRDSKIRTEFDCPHCGTHLKKRQLKKTTRYPVQVGYYCCTTKYRQETVAPPSVEDMRLLAKIEDQGVPEHLWYPTQEFPVGFNTRQPILAGIHRIDLAYTPRSLWAMAHLWNLAQRWPDDDIRSKLLFTLTSLYKRVTVFSEFRFWGGSGNTANLNVPAIMNEQNVFKAFRRKADTIALYFDSAPQLERNFRIGAQSALHLPQIPAKSIDYIFTDPPFGANINYSEMNFLWESWLGHFTDPTEEAIVNEVQGKQHEEYQELLTGAFQEAHRVLKDDSWMSVVFHNSSARTWSTLQAAISKSGFEIVSSQVFDKKHGTFKQFVSDNAVGYDLVLHCRKSISHQALRKNDIEATRQEAETFIAEQLATRAQKYRIHYMHVAREDEIDYRRLYTEWLIRHVNRERIGLSFAEFRTIVDDALGKLRSD